MGKMLSFVLVAVCACATQTVNKEKVVLYSTPGSPQPEGKVVCAVERPTGSNIAERICRYENQADFAAARAQDAIRDAQRRPCSDPTGCNH
jgi:hypothetical protein